MSDEAKARAAKALAVLSKLAYRGGTGWDATGSLHPHHLRDAKAISFMLTHKTSLLLGLTSGVGLVAAKLGANPDGSAIWSAPCFLTSASISLGLTVGSHDANVVMLLMDKDATDYVESHDRLRRLGLDSNVTVWENLLYGSSISPLTFRNTRAYVVANGGVMVDFSLTLGEIKADKELNKAFYGREVELKELLGGELPAPAEFQELYDALNEVMKMPPRKENAKLLEQEEPPK